MAHSAGGTTAGVAQHLHTRASRETFNPTSCKLQNTQSPPETQKSQRIVQLWPWEHRGCCSYLQPDAAGHREAVGVDVVALDVLDQHLVDTCGMAGGQTVQLGLQAQKHSPAPGLCHKPGAALPVPAEMQQKLHPQWNRNRWLWKEPLQRVQCSSGCSREQPALYYSPGHAAQTQQIY